jgi:hypothetical protein
MVDKESGKFLVATLMMYFLFWQRTSVVHGRSTPRGEIKTV